MALRRSGRQRTQSSKAAQQLPDAFSEIFSDSDAPLAEDEDDETEDDFAPPVQAEESDQDEDISGMEDFSDNDQDDFADEGDDDDMSDVISLDGLDRQITRRRVKPGERRKYERGAAPSDPDNRTRGVMEYNRTWLKHHYIPFTLGDDNTTYTAFLRMCKRFDNDKVLPKRSGMLHTFFQSEQSRQKEATSSWDWYYTNGRPAFRTRQTFEDLSDLEGKEYLEKPNAVGKNVILNPATNTQISQVEPLTSINLTNKQEDHSISGQPSKWMLHAGGCVQSIAWAPNQRNSMQYLAISTIRRENNIPAFSASPRTRSAIQIWGFEPTNKGTRASTVDTSTTPKLIQVYCCDFGRIRQLKWCPVLRKSPKDHSDERKIYLGLLAIVSSDGTVRILDISLTSEDTSVTRYVKVSSVAFESRPTETIFTSVAWNNSSTITAACANGYIALFDVASHCATSETSVARPRLYHPIHTSYIHAIVSCYPSSPHHIITSSADGNLILTDLCAPDSDTVAPARCRLSNSTLAWHSHLAHALYADDNARLRAYNPRQFSNGLNVFQAEGSLGVIDTSPVHASIVVGMLDGSVWVSNPTRRAVGKGERGKENGSRGGWKTLWLKHDWRRGRTVRKSATEPGQDQGSGRQDQVGPTTGHTTDVEMSGTAQAWDTVSIPAIATPQNSNIITSESSMQLDAEAMNGEAVQASTSAQESDIELDFPQGLSLMHTPPLHAERMSLTTKADIPTAAASAKSKTKIKNVKVRFEEKRSITIYEEEAGARAAAWNPNPEVGGWCAVGFGDGLVVVDDLCRDGQNDKHESRETSVGLDHDVAQGDEEELPEEIDSVQETDGNNEEAAEPMSE